MKKIHLSCFINFSDLDQLDNSPYIYTLINLSKKFGKINLINISNISFSKQNISRYKFEKYKSYFLLFNPKNLSDLNKFFQNKNVVVLNSIIRSFKNLPLLFFLRLKKIPLLEISNLGNIQIGTDEFLKIKNFNSFYETSFKNLIKKFFNILCILGIIQKVRCKFTSNVKIYKDFKNRKDLYNFFSYYKDIKLVKSNIYEKPKNSIYQEDYIVLLDVCPLYEQFTNYQKVKEENVKKHYKYLNNLLVYLQKIYKKKIVVCIHPKYPLKFYKKFLPTKKIVKYQTEKFISKSFIVLTFNSSAIVTAIKNNKKIIAIQSFLFKGKKYSSSIYQERLGTQKITLKKNYNFNKSILLKNLEKNKKKYLTFKDTYFGYKVNKMSSDDISNYIISLS